MAERWFKPSQPRSFERQEHASELWTVGNFDQENFGELISVRTEAIQREI